MRFKTKLRNQAVTIVYGTNPSGQVAGAWVELADGGPADLTPEENVMALKLAREHNLLALQSIRLMNAQIKFLPDGAFPEKPWVLSVTENGCTTLVDWFATYAEAVDAQKNYVNEGGAA